MREYSPFKPDRNLCWKSNSTAANVGESKISSRTCPSFSSIEQDEAGSRAVVGHYARDSSVRAELHELGTLGALLVLVTKHDAGHPKHDVQQFEMQVRIRLKPATK